MHKSECQGTVRLALVVAGCLSCFSLYGQTAASARGVEDVSSSPTSPLQAGPYYALVIGIKNYRHLKTLDTPIDDANEVAQLLRERYGFHPQVLLDANRDQILTALVHYRRTLPGNSNLLIYYAGHGLHDHDTDEAYWLPVDAQPDNNTNWISADDITSNLRAIPSSHVLVISDSCYSGYMARAADPVIDPKERVVYLAKILKSKSRNLLSSGRDEPVADLGAPGHSVFAGVILEGLLQMKEDEFTANELFHNFIQPKVGGRSEQLPQYRPIRNSGDDGGDFVFFRQPVVMAKTFLGHTGHVTSVAWSPNGKQLLTGSEDKTAKIWDAESTKLLLTLSGHNGGVTSVAWSPDGNWLATASDDRTVRIWNSAGDLQRTLEQKDAVQSVAWSPNSNWVAIGSRDRTASVWNAGSGHRRQTFIGHDDTVSSVAWSPDGDRLATGSWDKTARVWDVFHLGRKNLKLAGHTDWVSSVAWTRDGRRLATGSGKKVRIWDARTGTPLSVIPDNDNGDVTSLAWSPNGTRLATASWDKTAKVWGPAWDKALLLSGHSGYVTSVAWSPDGNRLATGSWDNTAKVWSVGTN